MALTQTYILTRGQKITLSQKKKGKSGGGGCANRNIHLDVYSSQLFSQMPYNKIALIPFCLIAFTAGAEIHKRGQFSRSGCKQDSQFGGEVINNCERW